MCLAPLILELDHELILRASNCGVAMFSNALISCAIGSITRTHGVNVALYDMNRLRKRKKATGLAYCIKEVVNGKDR